jgi:hypothetical protein
VLLENAVDFVVNGFDAVLLNAELAAGDVGPMIVSEVEVAEGLRSGDELGSSGDVVGAEGRVVRVGNVDLCEVGGETGLVTDSHLSIKIIKTCISIILIDHVGHIISQLLFFGGSR